MTKNKFMDLLSTFNSPILTNTIIDSHSFANSLVMVKEGDGDYRSLDIHWIKVPWKAWIEDAKQADIDFNIRRQALHNKYRRWLIEHCDTNRKKYVCRIGDEL